MIVARTLLATMLLLSCNGCAQVVMLGYLIGGPPSIEPDFDAATGESLSAPEIRTAVVCYAPTELKWDFETIDHEIATAVTARLSQNHVRVQHQESLRAWMDEHPDWERPEEIGEVFQVDYVIDIEINDFSLYEENSTTLYRGRTEAFVHVIKMDKATGEGEKIYTKELNVVFPISVPRSASDQSFAHFKREYLSRLSESIGWLFYEHYNGDKIPWAT